MSLYQKIWHEIERCIDIINIDDYIKYDESIHKIEVDIQEWFNVKKYDELLKSIIYPLHYKANEIKEDSISIQLNKDFTRSLDGHGYTQRWLVKDFVEALNKFNIRNVYNIRED